MMRALFTAVGALALLLSTQTARAFSDPSTFLAAPEKGGGGGRFFTGSPADGYTCTVCHTGGDAPPVHILGLPLAGYQPGQAYEVTLDWPDTLEHVSLAVEITDDQGIGAGTLRTPPMNELQASERCIGTPIGAGQVLPLLNRTVIAMPDCGALQMRFLWTAPMVDRGPVRLSGMVMKTDASEGITGDGVTEIKRVIGSPATPNAPASQLGGCSVRDRGAQPRFVFALCSLLALVVVRRYRFSARRASGRETRRLRRSS